MKILVDIGHPAHVHFFKNFIREMESRRHEILITASKKDVALQLLDKFGFKYIVMGSHGKSTVEKIINLAKMDIKIYRAVKTFQPDILIGVGSIRASHVAKLIRKPFIVFDDNELSKLDYWLYLPFASVVFTPSCFKKDWGKKHIRYHGYKELAYLHPKYFLPEPSVLGELGLTETDNFVILRFVSWQAAHDRGQFGFDDQAKIKLVRMIEEYATVFITSEAPLPAELEKYRIKISPEKLHHLLYYAMMVVSDSGTTSAEAGVLGTPTLRHNSFVGPNDLGFLAALEHTNGLIYSVRELDKVMEKVKEIISGPNMKPEWAGKREKLIADSIDLTAFITWFVEGYPDSFRIMKENPDYQDRFK